MQYVVWVEVRKFKIYLLLLVFGWIGFNIKVRDNMVVLESVIGYLDMLDFFVIDLKIVFEVFFRGCEVRDRLQLKVVVCVFDQVFYVKVMEVYWKNKGLFNGLVIMMGGFYLLMMLLGIIGCRFGDVGFWEIVVESDVVVEGFIEKVFSGKYYNRVVCFYKIVYEVMM